MKLKLNNITLGCLLAFSSTIWANEMTSNHVKTAQPGSFFTVKYMTVQSNRMSKRSRAFLVINSNIPGKNYPFAGLHIVERQHNLVNICEKKEGEWCRFNASNKPMIIPLNAIPNASLPSELTLDLSLNIQGSRLPQTADANTLSTQRVTVTAEPAGRIIGYLYGWETPPSAQSIAQAHYTHVILTFGLFSTTSPGAIDIQALSGISDLAGYIAQLHSYGIDVLLSIGGASTNIPNTTVSFNTAETVSPANPATFQTNFVNSIRNLVNTYNFDGFDFDIESGLYASNWSQTPADNFLYPNGINNDYCSYSNYTNSACTSAYLASIINDIYANVFTQSGQRLQLTLAPQIANIAATSTYNSTFGLYSSLILQTHDSLEWVAFQNYNSGCAYGVDNYCYPNPYGNQYPSLTTSPDSAVAFATDILATWPQGAPLYFLPYSATLTPSQVVIGYAVQNNDGASDGYPPAVLPIVQDAIQCLRTGDYCYQYNPVTAYPYTAYPGIGGVFAWTINYDANRNYEFSNTLYPCVVQGNCTYTQP